MTVPPDAGAPDAAAVRAGREDPRHGEAPSGADPSGVDPNGKAPSGEAPGGPHADDLVRHRVPMSRQRFEPDLWREHGFSSAEDSAWWSDRACGLACLRMLLLGWYGQAPSTAELLREARADGAYVQGKGWAHAGLARLGRRHGLEAEPMALTEEEIAGHLAKAPLIASVKIEFPVGQGRGGHLILLTGRSGSPAEPVFHFNDPSAWGQRNDRVSGERFSAAYSGRAIVFPRLEWAQRGSAA